MIWHPHPNPSPSFRERGFDLGSGSFLRKILSRAATKAGPCVENPIFQRADSKAGPCVGIINL